MPISWEDTSTAGSGFWNNLPVASLYLCSDSIGFHTFILVSFSPTWNYTLDFDSDNVLRLRDVQRPTRGAMFHVGNAPFDFQSLVGCVNGCLLPRGLAQERYSPLLLNCRTMAWMCLLCFGFSEARVQTAFSALGIRGGPFLTHHDIAPAMRKLCNMVVTGSDAGEIS